MNELYQIDMNNQGGCRAITDGETIAMLPRLIPNPPLLTLSSARSKKYVEPDPISSHLGMRLFTRHRRKAGGQQMGVG
jgi:hypothetical protein